MKNAATPPAASDFGNPAAGSPPSQPGLGSRAQGLTGSRAHGPLVTVLTCSVTSDRLAQPCTLSGAYSAVYWSGG